MTSYANMDHAAWVERQIAAWQLRFKPNKREMAMARDGRGWYGAPITLNHFQRRAIDMLGIVGNGIYNAPLNWKTLTWRPDSLEVSWRNSLATYDFSCLTRLAFLAHEGRMRVGI